MRVLHLYTGTTSADASPTAALGEPATPTRDSEGPPVPNQATASQNGLVEVVVVVVVALGVLYLCKGKRAKTGAGPTGGAGGGADGYTTWN